MFKKTLLILMSLGLVACNELEGVTTVSSPIALLQGDELVVLPEGQFETELDFKSKKKIELKMNVNGTEEEFVLKFTREVKIPKNNGTFQVSKEENSQGIDITGTVQTETERGDRRFERETCEYQRVVTRCRVNRSGRRVCRNYTITERGWRDVEFRMETDKKEYNIQFQRDELEGLASFFANRNITRKIYEYRGRCI